MNDYINKYFLVVKISLHIWYYYFFFIQLVYLCIYLTEYMCSMRIISTKIPYFDHFSKYLTENNKLSKGKTSQIKKRCLYILIILLTLLLIEIFSRIPFVYWHLVVPLDVTYYRSRFRHYLSRVSNTLIGCISTYTDHNDTVLYPPFIRMTPGVWSES